MSTKIKKIVTKILMYSFVWAIVIITIYPLILMILTSVRTDQDFNQNAAALPSSIRLMNYVEAWTQGKIAILGLNTIIVTTLTIAFCILFASMTGFAIEKMLTKYSTIVYNYFVIGIIVPIQVLMIPLFKVLKQLNLINKYHGIVLIYIALNLCFAIFMYTGFYKMIPNQLLEAAEIDGSSIYRTFFQIVLPLTKTVTATVAILTGMAVWKDLTVPLIYITNPNLKTLSVGLFYFRNAFADRTTVLMAAMCIQTIPIVILFLLMQKSFIKGIADGAVKG